MTYFSLDYTNRPTKASGLCLFQLKCSFSYRCLAFYTKFTVGTGNGGTISLFVSSLIYSNTVSGWAALTKFKGYTHP